MLRIEVLPQRVGENEPCSLCANVWGKGYKHRIVDSENFFFGLVCGTCAKKEIRIRDNLAAMAFKHRNLSDAYRRAAESEIDLTAIEGR